MLNVSAEKFLSDKQVTIVFYFFFLPNERVCAFVFHIRHTTDVCNLIIKKKTRYRYKQEVEFEILTDIAILTIHRQRKPQVHGLSQAEQTLA